MDIAGIVRWVIGLVGATVVACFGPPFGVVFIGLICLMLLDTFLAVLANGRRRSLDPDAGIYGFKRKLGTLSFLLAFAIMYRMAQYAGDWQLDRFPAPTIFVLVFGLFEIGSMVVNAKLCGVVFPGPIGQFVDWLAQYIAPQKLGAVPKPDLPHG